MKIVKYMSRNWTVSYIKKAEIRISNEPPSAQTEEADPGVTPPLHPVVRNFGNLLRDMAQSPGDDDTGLDLSDSDEGVTTDPALYGDILSPSGSESYITASEDDRDSDWTSLHGTSVSDSSSSIHSLSPRDRFFSVTESQPDVLTPTADDETEDSLILRTTADDIYLMQVSSSKLVCVASIREVLVGWEDRYSYRGMNRLSMVEWIPELSLAVVVSQMGKVGLVEVLR